MHDSTIIILLSFGTLFVHIRPWMAAQAINFFKHCKILFFVQVGVVCAACWQLWDLSQQSNNSYIRVLDEDSFDMLQFSMIAEQPSLTQYERLMYHMRENTNMLSSITISWFFFSILRFMIESRFPFLNTLYYRRKFQDYHLEIFSVDRSCHGFEKQRKTTTWPNQLNGRWSLIVISPSVSVLKFYEAFVKLID